MKKLLKNKKTINTIKIILTITLLLFLISSINWNKTLSIISNVKKNVLLFALILSFTRFYISSYRWQIIVKKFVSENVSIFRLMNWYFISNFYNNILPSTIGGDAFRIIYLKEYIKNFFVSFISVLLERISGILAIILLFLISALVVKQSFPFVQHIILIILIALILLILLIYSPFQQKIESTIKKYNRNIWKQYLLIVNLLKKVRKDSLFILKVILLSLLFQILDIIVIYLFGIALGIKLHFIYYIFTLTLLYLITLIPISINGYGVREGFLVYVFSLLNVSIDLTAGLLILFNCDRILKGLFGGFLLILKNTKKTSSFFYK